MAKTTTMKLERSACGKFFRFNAIIRCSYVADLREKFVTEWVAVPKVTRLSLRRWNVKRTKLLPANKRWIASGLLKMLRGSHP